MNKGPSVTQVSINKAAKTLGVSIKDVETLIQDELLQETSPGFLSSADINEMTVKKSLSVADEATQVGIQLQHQTSNSLSFIRKTIIIAAGALGGYILLVILLSGLFIVNPTQTAQWLGFFSKSPENITSGIENNSSKVLAASTSKLPNQPNIVQVILQPVGKASLGLLKNISPSSYTQVSKLAILDPNDVLGLDTSGSIIPERPINLPESSFLQIGTSGLVTNLNSQYLQGKQPGTNQGDLQIVGLTPIPATPATGLTNANLSGKAGITNDNLANSALTINTSGPISGGGAVSLGGSLTIDCPTCTTTGLSLVEADTLESITGRGATTSTNISTTGGGMVTSGGLLTASNGLTLTTGAINLTGTSGVLALSGLGASSINTGANNLTITSGNFNTTATGINGTIIGATTAAAGTFSTLNDSGLSISSIVYTDGSKNLTSTAPTTGTLAFWNRVGTTLSPGTSGDAITTTGNISTTSSGTITSAGLLTASNGLTLSGGGLNLTSTSGALAITGLGSSTLSTTSNGLTLSTVTSGTLAVSSAGALNLTGASASTWSLGANALTLTSSKFNISSAGLVTLAGGLTTDLTTPAATALTIDSGTTGALNLGTGNNAKTITIGNNTGATALAIISGTASQTFTSSLISGTAFVFNANATATGQSQTGLSLLTSADTNISNSTKIGLTMTSGAITENTAAATGTVLGADITMGSLTLSSGTALNSHGLRVTTGNVTQSAGVLTENGILVDSTSSTITTGGTINSLKINAPTTILSVGTYNNIFLGTSTGSVANTTDQATIAVGNIASTATNNYSTLNIKNGGSGFLDVELQHGMLNFIGMNTLYDDFTNNTLDTNKWTTTASGGGSTCALGAGSLGGLLVMTAGTGGANRACELSTKTVTTLTSGYYQAGNNPVFETKLNVNSLVNDIYYAGFTDTRAPLTNTNTNASTNHAYFTKRTTDTNWQCVTDDGTATESFVDTGVAVVANTTYRLRVEVRNGTTPETICTVDDGTTITRVTNTAHQPGTTSPMDAYLQIDVTANTTAKVMNVDYVRVWQDDPVSGIAVTSPTNTDSTASTALVQEALNLTNKDINELLGEVSKPTNSTFMADLKIETQFDPVTIIAQKIIDEKQFLVNFVSARITAIRGYFDQIFANKVHTKQVCLGKSDGNEVCINGDDLNKLLPSPTNTPAPLSTNESTPTESPTPTISPIETHTPVPTDSPVASPARTAIPNL